MVPQRICISKQVTFIAFIFVLLFGYLFFAYWTSTNKTSTNSRASDIDKNKITKKITPTTVPPDCDHEDCIYLPNPVIDSQKKVQFRKPLDYAPDIEEKDAYVVFYRKIGEPAYSSKQLTSVKGKDLKKTLEEFSNQKVDFPPSEVGMYEFVVYQAK